MEFLIYNQKQVLSCPELAHYLVDTIVDNLSYIYGEDMGSEENKKEWITYNLKTENPSWRVVTGARNGSCLGFLIYAIENRCLTVHDIEIVKSSRRNPVLLSGLFKTMFAKEQDRFDTIAGYINKDNKISQSNFLKYATSVTERSKGYSFLIGEDAAGRLKARVLCQQAE